MTATAPSALHRTRGRAVWGILWRMSLIVLTGLVGVFVIYGELLATVDPAGPDAPVVMLRLLLDVGLGLTAIVLYPFRHRAPLVIVMIIVFTSAFSALAVGAATFAVVSISTRRRWQEIGPVAAAFAAALIVGEFALPNSDPTPWWELGLYTSILLAILVITGMYIGGRRQLRRTLAEKAESDRREQRASVEQARLNERARIAREMHDVLAHRLSLVALHAGALEYRADLTPQQKQATAGVVRENAHLALTELREVLGVLRDAATPEAEDGTRPQPTLATLSDLLDDSRLAGSPATLTIDAAVATELSVLPESTSRHLYRIVQEGLTNARKHAPGATVDVQIGGEPHDRVTLRLTNAVQPADAATMDRGQPASGLGLTGLTERARLAGGELSVGAAAGRFTLEAWLPWTN